MALKTKRDAIDRIVNFTTRDPNVEAGEDILVQIARAFPKVSNDDFDEAVNHMLRMLRCYVALDDAEARVKPKPEVMPKRKRKRRRKSGQSDLFRQETTP